MIDFDVLASRAVEPFFYRADAPANMTPYPYQVAGVEYMLRRRHGMFGDAPGLGKTAECILLSNALQARWNLVICPASLVLNWEREIHMWSTIEPRVTTYPVRGSKSGISNEHNYVILSYDMLRSKPILAAILSELWDHVILDEGHFLKDVKGNGRTKAICAPDCIPRVAGRITMATGTPMPNQPLECLGGSVRVLTDSGWKPIVDVRSSDLLWDGEEWVEHGGLLYQGCARTVSVAGILATETHRFLARSSWVSAAEAAQNMDIVRQMLETGSANLPSMDSRPAKAELLQRFGFYAIAAARFFRPLFSACGPAGQLNVGLAARFKALKKRIVNTLRFAPIQRCARGCCPSLEMWYKDVVIRGISRTSPTAAGVSRSTALGSTTGGLSSSTLYLSMGVISWVFNWIALTMIKDTSQGTSDGRLADKTCPIAGLLRNCNCESVFLRPVYDIANAGPRQRFTILSDHGPVISHNCYNACRLLNWDCINRASLEDFRATYYEMGEGFVRSRQFDTKKQAFEIKLHWSNTVRNVPRNLEDLQHRLRKHIMARRLKEDVLKQLPPKQWHPFPMAVDAGVREALRHPGWAIAEKLYDMDPEAFDAGVPVDGAMATARRVLGEAKVGAVVAYIEEMIREGVGKIVVATWHRNVLAALSKALSKHRVVVVDGGMTTAKKQAAVDLFQFNPDIKIIAGQMKVLGIGWTLTAAQDVVFAEFDYVPGNNDQFLDRVHRPGQAGGYVLGHVPLVLGSLEEKIMSAAVHKSRHIHAALDEKPLDKPPRVAKGAVVFLRRRRKI
jgi:hypothetical protein